MRHTVQAKAPGLDTPHPPAPDAHAAQLPDLRTADGEGPPCINLCISSCATVMQPTYQCKKRKPLPSFFPRSLHSRHSFWWREEDSLIDPVHSPTYSVSHASIPASMYVWGYGGAGDGKGVQRLQARRQLQERTDSMRRRKSSSSSRRGWSTESPARSSVCPAVGCQASQPPIEQQGHYQQSSQL